MFVYIKSEPCLWTVGHYAEDSRAWVPESDHDSPEKAGNRCAFLNGGVPRRPATERAEDMTKREVYAANALPGLAGGINLPQTWGRKTAKEVALAAVGIADALIAELARTDSAVPYVTEGLDDAS